MTKIRLYTSEAQISIPGIVYQTKIYRDKDEKCYVILDDENKNPYVVYPLIAPVSGEPYTTPYNDDGVSLKGDDVMLGKAIYSSHFEISNMSWDGFKSDVDPREDIAVLQNRVSKLEYTIGIQRTSIDALKRRVEKLEGNPEEEK